MIAACPTHFKGIIKEVIKKREREERNNHEEIKEKKKQKRIGGGNRKQTSYLRRPCTSCAKAIKGPKETPSSLETKCLDIAERL
jgi:hypothetical protein